MSLVVVIHIVKIKASIVVKGWYEVHDLLLLGGGSAGAVDSLLNLTSKAILGCVELRANGAVLGERSTNLLQMLVSIVFLV